MEWQHEFLNFFSDYEAARVSFVVACVLTPLYFLLAPAAACCCAMMRRMHTSMPLMPSMPRLPRLPSMPCMPRLPSVRHLPRPSLGESPLSMRASALFDTPRGSMRGSPMTGEDARAEKGHTRRSCDLPSPSRTQPDTPPTRLSARKSAEAAASLLSPYAHNRTSPPQQQPYANDHVRSMHAGNPRGSSCDRLHPAPLDPYLRDLAYRKSSCTRQALDELYTTPAFQRWYREHRPRLMQMASLRHQGHRWSHLATLFVLLIALCLLPAFQLSSSSSAAAQHGHSLASQVHRLSHILPRGMGGGDWASHSSPDMSLAQLLMRRAHHVLHQRKPPVEAWWPEAWRPAWASRLVRGGGGGAGGGTHEHGGSWQGSCATMPRWV